MQCTRPLSTRIPRVRSYLSKNVDLEGVGAEAVAGNSRFTLFENESKRESLRTSSVEINDLGRFAGRMGSAGVRCTG